MASVVADKVNKGSVEDETVNNNHDNLFFIILLFVY
ncbi:hypothetical protein GIG_02893 [Mycoplasmopsis anatis 1340]|uniref:Uncharacterized protein n=1 Tax=Mycoplasmopsis anatis 1340 TaxID=1034808 RepID=F9QDV3_9BACT|nr:hypothetical protein GIG_02893 [Mycoplasmopsis anatis 1340]